MPVPMLFRYIMEPRMEQSKLIISILLGTSNVLIDLNSVLKILELRLFLALVILYLSIVPYEHPARTTQQLLACTKTTSFL